jgi:hypothetical protein
MRVVARIETVPGSNMHDRAQDAALCFSCGDKGPVCEMYYRSEFAWRMVRCHRHMWALNNRGLFVMCRMCKCTHASRERLRRRLTLDIFSSPIGTGDPGAPASDTHATVGDTHAGGHSARVCGGAEHGAQ